MVMITPTLFSMTMNIKYLIIITRNLLMTPPFKMNRVILIKTIPRNRTNIKARTHSLLTDLNLRFNTNINIFQMNDTNRRRILPSRSTNAITRHMRFINLVSTSTPRARRIQIKFRRVISTTTMAHIIRLKSRNKIKGPIMTTHVRQRIISMSLRQTSNLINNNIRARNTRTSFANPLYLTVLTRARLRIMRQLIAMTTQPPRFRI